MASEFQDLRRIAKTMTEITARFREMALMVPQYVVDKEMKKTRYHNMLREDIQKFSRVSA